MAYINETGLPSVTDTLAPWIDTKWFTEDSRLRGDYAHDRVACHVSSEFFIGDRIPAYEPYYESFLNSFADRIEDVVLVEERLTHDVLDYCGQPDLLFVDRLDGLRTLVDWKTATGIYKYWPIQLGGYSLLLENNGYLVEKVMIARLRAEANKKVLVNTYDMLEGKRLFMNNLEIFKLLSK